MTKTQQNLANSEEFIRKVLADNFRQNVDEAALKSAAQKLCDAIPEATQGRAD